MSDYKTIPYPGYNTNVGDQTPVHNGRVKPEAELYATRARGSLDLFAATPRYVEEQMPEPRCLTQDARQNYELGRNGTVSNLLYGQATPRTDQTAVPRVKDEARSIAESHQGKETLNLLNSYGHLSLETPAPARVKPEASSTAEQHKGGRMNSLIHDPKRLPVSVRAAPRVKAEASGNAELDRGGQMNKTLHSYGTLSSRPEYIPRVKPEASDNAEKGKGYMGTLLGKYGKLPLDQQPNPKVRGQGEEYANLDKGNRMLRLMHEASSLPQDPKPPPRTHTKAARSIMRAHRGQMAKVFKEQGKFQAVVKPGLRSAPALKIY